MAKKIILFVAMPDSIHTARWLKQLLNEDWDIHLFPSTIISMLHSDIYDVTLHGLFYSTYLSGKSKSKFISFVERAVYFVLRRFFEKLVFKWQAKQLAKLIKKLQPAVIHSMEMQAAGYLTLTARLLTKEQFPPWIVTIWGSDLFWFGQFLKHQDKIRKVLQCCDYFFCECQRDRKLAKDFGFDKVIFPSFPATGGFNLSDLSKQRYAIMPSERKIIAIKGYQHWVGRALIILEALPYCLDILQDYEIVIYSASFSVVAEAKSLIQKFAINLKILSNNLPHADILTLHSKARVSIALSLSDGLPNTLLEAMVMGSLPIQSCTACADEWIEHGVSGAIVPPEEPEVVAMWLRKALTDDDWVNQAAELNWQTALKRLDGEMLAKQAVAMYNMV